MFSAEITASNSLPSAHTINKCDFCHYSAMQYSLPLFFVCVHYCAFFLVGDFTVKMTPRCEVEVLSSFQNVGRL